MKIKERLISLNDIDDIVNRLPKENADNAKRQLRTSLFSAFDIHKSNVSYGAETETKEERKKMIQWREDLKDLKTSAFKEIPEAINYYLRG